MRRGNNKSIEQYIEIRIDQLKEDMKKASNEYDKQWYNRIISELNWAKAPNHNCYIESDARSNWHFMKSNVT